MVHGIMTCMDQSSNEYMSGMKELVCWIVTSSGLMTLLSRASLYSNRATSVEPARQYLYTKTYTKQLTFIVAA